MRVSFREHMVGSYHLLDRALEDRGADLAIEVSTERTRDFVRDPVLRVAGELTLDGFASKRPCTGTIALKIANEQRIPYDVRFAADDGRDYRLYGQRDLSIPKLVDALTTLPMSLCDESGHEIGRAVLRFDPKNELAQLFRSVRVKVR